MFGSFKDTAAKVAANRHPLVKRFGTVHQIRIDAHNSSLQLEMGLVGESEPIGITLRYSLREENGHTVIAVDSIAISRAWLQEAAQIWLTHKGPVVFKLDGIAGQLVQFLL